MNNNANEPRSSNIWECSPRLETARCLSNVRCFKAFHTWDERRRRQIELIQFKYSQHPCQRCIGMRMPKLEVLAVVNMGFNWHDKIVGERRKYMIESSPSRTEAQHEETYSIAADGFHIFVATFIVDRSLCASKLFYYFFFPSHRSTIQLFSFIKFTFWFFRLCISFVPANMNQSIRTGRWATPAAAARNFLLHFNFSSIFLRSCDIVISWLSWIATGDCCFCPQQIAQSSHMSVSAHEGRQKQSKWTKNVFNFSAVVVLFFVIIPFWYSTSHLDSAKKEEIKNKKRRMQLSHQLCTNWSFFRQQFARVDKNVIVSIAANHPTDTQKCHSIVVLLPYLSENSRNRDTRTERQKKSNCCFDHICVSSLDRIATQIFRHECTEIRPA